MKKAMIALLAAACICSASVPAMAAQNTKQDMAKVTCAELQKSSKEEKTLLLMWMDGFIAGEDDSTIMSDAWLEKLATHIFGYCDKNPNNTIKQAMDAMK